MKYINKDGHYKLFKDGDTIKLERDVDGFAVLIASACIHGSAWEVQPPLFGLENELFSSRGETEAVMWENRSRYYNSLGE